MHTKQPTDAIVDSVAVTSSVADQKKMSYSNRFAAIAGNTLEFYDFTVYSFFASILGKQFFPSGSSIASLLITVAVFGVGFVARPFGAIIIGSLADRKGRKPAMLLTMALMAVGMLIIILTPPYAVIGLSASILIVAARLIQGFAWGGEAGPTTSFLVESAPEGSRGFYASWQIASQGFAVFFSGLVGVVTSTFVAPGDMLLWGWRIPFAIGLLVIPMGYVLRRNLHESAPSKGLSTKNILRELLRHHWKLVTLCVMVVVPSTVTLYISNYMTSYALTVLHLPLTKSLSITLVVGVTLFVSALLGGLLCDRYGRKPIMISSCTALLLFAYPGFRLLDGQYGALYLYLTPAILAALTGLGAAGIVALVSESFPKSIRSTGFALTLAIAITIFGGSAQYVVTWLISVTGDHLSPAWCLMGAAVIGLIGVFGLAESKGNAIE